MVLVSLEGSVTANQSKITTDHRSHVLNVSVLTRVVQEDSGPIHRLQGPLQCAHVYRISVHMVGKFITCS